MLRPLASVWWWWTVLSTTTTRTSYLSSPALRRIDRHTRRLEALRNDTTLTAARYAHLHGRLEMLRHQRSAALLNGPLD